jgi:hypothetical protein
VVNTSLEYVVQELGKVKQELRQLKIEYQKLRIATLERELKQLSDVRVQIEAERDLLQQDVEDLDLQMAQPLDSESYAGLAEVRSNLIRERVSAVRAEYDKTAQRQADVINRLERGRRKLRDLMQ